MKKIYTAAAKPANRTVTIADMRAAKGKRKLVQVTANTANEASAVEKAGVNRLQKCKSDGAVPNYLRNTRHGPDRTGSFPRTCSKRITQISSSDSIDLK